MTGNTLKILVAVFLFMPAESVLADGMFVAYDPIHETAQLAFIDHDDGVESLHILPMYEGQATEFAWIVPVPSLPTVEESGIQLFYDLANLTSPVYRHRDGFLDCQDMSYGVDVSGRNEVTVHESELVGIYETMIISAVDAVALSDSLIAWGLLREESAEDIQSALDSYVDRGWYFVTMKVSNEDPDPYDVWYGGVHPIELTFASEDLIYPLEISRSSAANVTELVLYVAADHRMDFPGAETAYANKLTAPELTSIRQRHGVLGAQLVPGDFITKLTRTYSPVEMDTDIVLTVVSGDRELREIIYSGWPIGMGILMLTAVVLKLPMVRRRFRSA